MSVPLRYQRGFGPVPADPNQVLKNQQQADADYWKRYYLLVDQAHQGNTNRDTAIRNANDVAQALENLSQLGYSLGQDTFQNNMALARIGADLAQQRVANRRYLMGLQQDIAQTGYSHHLTQNNAEEELARARQAAQQSFGPSDWSRSARLLGYPS